MRKILTSLVMIAVVASTAVGATQAYFVDTETSAANTFAAGSLNLNVDGNEGVAVAHVTFNNVVPAVQWLGAEYDHQWVLNNTGSLPGNLSYSIKNIKNYENVCLTPETVMGDVTCLSGNDQGELGNQIKLLFQLNQAPYGYNQEVYPVSAVTFTNVPAYHLNAGESKAVFLRSWLINAANNNLVQGDSLEFDIEFTLTQE